MLLWRLKSAVWLVGGGGQGFFERVQISLEGFQTWGICGGRVGTNQGVAQPCWCWSRSLSLSLSLLELMKVSGWCWY
ncbi:hypothetical protein T484DRAFT_3537135 [Baffinella frigidus]|nr:hypothetical protein T484DRAFT_3537135 [Cryptophyta sp. CCMP2293]